jgi:hypothetical protein
MIAILFINNQHFLDETWIDTNMRVAKGWIPRKCDGIKDMVPSKQRKLAVVGAP